MAEIIALPAKKAVLPLTLRPLRTLTRHQQLMLEFDRILKAGSHDVAYPILERLAKASMGNA
jgi:hypothetical protein